MRSALAAVVLIACAAAGCGGADESSDAATPATADASATEDRAARSESAPATAAPPAPEEPAAKSPADLAEPAADGTAPAGREAPVTTEPAAGDAPPPPLPRERDARSPSADAPAPPPADDAPPPLPRERSAPPVAQSPPRPPAGTAGEYVGDKACQKCHFQQHKSWRKTPHARALATLAPTPADQAALRDAKTRAGLDPERDYAADAACVACHVTGFGEATGFPADPRASEEAARAAKTLGSVSCEACHGAGSRYVKHKIAAVERDKDAKFARADLEPLGLVAPDERLCARCHNERSPTRPAGGFSVADAKAKVHDHPAR
jgi:hypothetical protein